MPYNWQTFLLLNSVCLPTVLIPIIKLSTSPNVLSKEFRPSLFMQITCWGLTLVVIAFDIFLFIIHATNLTSAIIIGITGVIYLIFLVYLVWKPLEAPKLSATEDGWMSLPQNENDVDDSFTSEEAESSNRRTNKYDDDAEEIYAL